MRREVEEKAEADAAAAAAASTEEMKTEREEREVDESEQAQQAVDEASKEAKDNVSDKAPFQMIPRSRPRMARVVLAVSISRAQITGPFSSLCVPFWRLLVSSRTLRATSTPTASRARSRSSMST